MRRSDYSRLARRVIGPIAVAAMLATSSSAFALASGSVVFDPTNWAENLRSALTSVKQYAQDVAQTANLVRQLKHMAANSEQLLASVLFEGMSDQQRRAAMEAVKFYDDLRQLESSLEDLQGAYDRKLNASFNANMTIDEFMKRSREEARRGVKASQNSINQDVKALQRVQDTYTAVAKWQIQNEASLGHQQSLQLMNTQMSALVGQNAEIISALLKANIEKNLAADKERLEAAATAADQVKRSEADRESLRRSAAAMDAQFKAAKPISVAK